MKKYPLLKDKEIIFKKDKSSFYRECYVSFDPIDNSLYTKLTINKNKHHDYLMDSLRSEKYILKKDNISNDYIDAFGFALMSQFKKI